jgi:hypothetical protein
MQKKTKFIAGIIVAVIVLFFLLKAVQRRHDPMVDGMALSDWLSHLNYQPLSPNTRTNRVWTEEVVRKTGTNAIPLLLEQLSMDEDSRSYQLKEKLAQLAHIEIWPPFHQRWNAVAAFRVLGTNGQAAVPQLKLMLENTNHMDYAAMCLGAVRAPEALMIFTNLLGDADNKKRETGLYGLGALQEIARPLLPQLTTMAKHETNTRVKITIIEVLGQVGSAEAVLPVLTQITQTDTNGVVRFMAAATMGAFYLEPEKARAALQVAGQDKDQRVRDGAAMGMKQLEEKIATEELRKIRRQQYYPWPDLDNL